MQREPNKIAILVSNYFTSLHFDDVLKTVANVGHVDIISSESGKIKSWDKTEKQYHTIVLYNNEIDKISALDYHTIIVHNDLVNSDSQFVKKEIVSFINKFMGRKKPIVAVCQNEWTIIFGSNSKKKLEMPLPLTDKIFKISA